MELRGKKVLVMGLGLNGGGLASARFACQQGAKVTVTDLRSQATLQPSLQQLADLPVRYVLGEHRPADFIQADVVVKNPAIPNDSPLLGLAQRVETDISLFLALRPRQPVYAITGTKGKSTVATLLAHLLAPSYPEVKLGGNVGRSPLTFVDQLEPGTPVVLELSSWQLHDLGGRELLRPTLAIITNIMPDHLNRYPSFAAYAQDKLLIYKDMKEKDTVFLPQQTVGQGWSASWAADCQQWQQRVPARVIWAHPSPTSQRPAAWCDEQQRGWLDCGKGGVPLFTQSTLPGEVGAYNSLLAASAAALARVPPSQIARQVACFPGLEHRLQKVCDRGGVSYYNDSAATVPEATVAALLAFPHHRIHLIVGGTDKELDFAPLYRQLKCSQPQLYLLDGSASQHKLIPQLEQLRYPYAGPFGSMAAVLAAIDPQPGEVVLLSPGCTSFEMFLNEFDRGRQFCRSIQSLLFQKDRT